MNRGNILFRVDGSSATGMGRVARCMALANALQRRRYLMNFLSNIDNNGWPDRIRRFRHTVTKTTLVPGSAEDREELHRQVLRSNPLVLITDAPTIGADYLRSFCDMVPLVISLDDAARCPYPSDVVLNPTLGWGKEEYELGRDTQLVSGNRYAMIRSEFRRARAMRATEPGGPSRALICLGGGDVAEDTLAYAAALLDQKVVEKVDAVVGTSAVDKETQGQIHERFGGAVSIIADARDLGVRMTKSHLLICGGGNTALEAACVGIPMILVTRQAHYERNATWLEEIGVAQYLGARTAVQPGQVAEAGTNVLTDNFERKAMIRSGRMLIDGRGADRLVTVTEILLRRNRRLKGLLAA